MENKQRDKKKTRQVNEGLFVLAYCQMLKCSTLITNKGNQEGEFKLRSGILLIYWFLHLLGFMVLISHGAYKLQTNLWWKIHRTFLCCINRWRQPFIQKLMPTVDTFTDLRFKKSTVCQLDVCLTVSEIGPLECYFSAKCNCNFVRVVSYTEVINCHKIFHGPLMRHDSC